MSWEDAADDEDAWEVNELPADTAAPAAPPTDDGAEWTSAVAAPAPAPAPVEAPAPAISEAPAPAATEAPAPAPPSLA